MRDCFAQEPLMQLSVKISPELFDQYEIFKSREMLLEWSPAMFIKQQAWQTNQPSWN